MTDAKESVLEIASKYMSGLNPSSLMLEEVGLDFKVGFIQDTDGQGWILRIPRRPDVVLGIEREARILELLKAHVSFAVPDWVVCSEEIIISRFIPGKLLFSVDEMITGKADYAFYANNESFIHSFAKALVEIHAIPEKTILEAGLELRTIHAIHANLKEKLKTVAQKWKVSESFAESFLSWVENEDLWPRVPALVHGDLYIGHILCCGDSVSGILDWTEARYFDPALDFYAHFLVFGEESLDLLLTAYAAHGGVPIPKARVKAMKLMEPLQVALFALRSGSTEYADHATVLFEDFRL